LEYLGGIIGRQGRRSCFEKLSRCIFPDVTEPDFAEPPWDAVSGEGPLERSFTVGDLSVGLRDHRWRHAISGVFKAADHVLLDMAVTPRPALVQGWFTEAGGQRHWGRLGELLVVPPGIAFEGYAPGGASRLYRHRSLTCALPRRLFDALHGQAVLWHPNLFQRCMNLRSPLALQSLRRVLQELLEPGFASASVLEGLATVVAVDVARTLHDAAHLQSPRGGLTAWRQRLLEDRLYDEDLPPPGILELAELVGLSERQLMRAFRQQHGISLGQQVRIISIERSKRLLAGQRLAVKDIAVTLGFAGPASFSHAFHQATGLRPTEYQRMCGQWATGGDLEK
jgi:AraC family transcriptional regulator